ncbi:hypothetical protein FBU59_001493 [Linderina macrospora]|uniref:Uncharacterized protein n=1 Tax=Linderina macrospora TaxID=4868 RepID=A0ACC1JDT1_9FUNG|nr:hypothetical protein FBU59_001493 [Linderina macrospora]
MEHKVRQFYSADGTSFVEHVPGHCLVFIPNNVNIDYMLREIKKVRAPRPQRKPKEKSNKPTNAFIKYRNFKIVDLKKKHPEISQTDISRMAGECWKTESLEVKERFRKQYQEEKKVYDANKSSKRSRMESEVDSEVETQTERSPSLSNSDHLHHSTPSNASTIGNADRSVGNGFGLGLGLSSFDGPLGFNPGRRRSQTLPSNSFARSGAKRRISQELRKHLAGKSNAAFMTAAATANAQKTHAHPEQNSLKQSNMDFNFVNGPLHESPVMTDPSHSPFMAASMSPMLMPLNPGFPISDFSTPALSTAAPAASMTINTTVGYAHSADGFEVFSPDQEDMAAAAAAASSWNDANFAASLGMMSTSTAAAVPISTAPFMVDAAAAAVAATAGYTDISNGIVSSLTATPPTIATVNTWPMPQSFNLVPEQSSMPQ